MNGRGEILLPAAARREWQEHWPTVIGAAAGYAVAAVVNYLMGVFLEPLQTAFGWSRAEISSGQFILSTTAVVLGPLIGLAVDRFGPRRIGLIGVAALCGSLSLLSTATASLVWWWTLWAMVALAALFAKAVVWTAGVASRFTVSRGFAFALLMTGGSFTATVTPLLSTYLIDHIGWRQAFVATGIIWFVMVFPVVYVCFDRRGGQSDSGQEATRADIAGMSAREAVRSATFRQICLGSICMAISVTPLTNLAVPVVTSWGHERVTAAALAGLVGVAALGGRLTTGYLLDRLNAKYVAAATMLLPAIGGAVLLTFGHDALGAGVAVVLVGLAFGAEVDAMAFITGRYFGLRSFGLLFSIVVGLATFGNGLGPFLGNLLFDVTGTYQVTVRASIAMALLASVLFATLPRAPQPAPEPA